MRAIATKVDCSPGILYHYFTDKQKNMARLIRETFVRLRARLTAIMNDTDAIEASLRSCIDFGLANPHPYALLFMNAAI